MMPDLFVELAALFELASLEVKEATVSDCVLTPQLRRTCCPTVTLSN